MFLLSSPLPTFVRSFVHDDVDDVLIREGHFADGAEREREGDRSGARKTAKKSCMAPTN